MPTKGPKEGGISFKGRLKLSFNLKHVEFYASWINIRANSLMALKLTTSQIFTRVQLCWEKEMNLEPLVCRSFTWWLSASLSYLWWCFPNFDNLPYRMLLVWWCNRSRGSLLVRPGRGKVHRHHLFFQLILLSPIHSFLIRTSFEICIYAPLSETWTVRFHLFWRVE